MGGARGAARDAADALASAARGALVQRDARLARAGAEALREAAEAQLEAAQWGGAAGGAEEALGELARLAAARARAPRRAVRVGARGAR